MAIFVVRLFPELVVGVGISTGEALGDSRGGANGIVIVSVGVALGDSRGAADGIGIVSTGEALGDSRGAVDSVGVVSMGEVLDVILPKRHPTILSRMYFLQC